MPFRHSSMTDGFTSDAPRALTTDDPPLSRVVRFTGPSRDRLAATADPVARCSRRRSRSGGASPPRGASSSPRPRARSAPAPATWRCWCWRTSGSGRPGRPPPSCSPTCAGDAARPAVRAAGRPHEPPRLRDRRRRRPRRRVRRPRAARTASCPMLALALLAGSGTALFRPATFALLPRARGAGAARRGQRPVRRGARGRPGARPGAGRRAAARGLAGRRARPSTPSRSLVSALLLCRLRGCGRWPRPPGVRRRRSRCAPCSRTAASAR